MTFIPRQVCTLQCAHTHIRTHFAQNQPGAFYSLFFCSLFHSFIHSLSFCVCVCVSVCVCVLRWRVEPVSAMERQAQPGGATMPLKLRRGLNRGDLCWYSVNGCVYVYVQSLCVCVHAQSVYECVSQPSAFPEGV